MSTQETSTIDLRDRLFAAAQEYDRAAQKFWEAAERCEHCDSDDSSDHCAEHGELAITMTIARRRLLDLAHETGV